MLHPTGVARGSWLGLVGPLRVTGSKGSICTGVRRKHGLNSLLGYHDLKLPSEIAEITGQEAIHRMRRNRGLVLQRLEDGTVQYIVAGALVRPPVSRDIQRR